MTPSAVNSSSQFNVDNMDVDGYLEDDRITESDLKAGKYDYAKTLIFEVNWADTPYQFSKILDIKRSGVLGEVKLTKTQFTAEIRGKMQHLQSNVGDLYQASCRAKFGDARCGVNKNLPAYKFSGSVLSVSGNRVITCALTNADGFFSNGELIFTSGLNQLFSLEIKSWVQSGSVLELHIPANYKISVGDTFFAIKGCQQTITFCHDSFGNARRFRGEPYVPQNKDLINDGQ